MRWGKAGWDLGSWAGHGFGGGLFPLALLRGLQARCRGRCGKPRGLFRAPVSWGTQLPSTPLGPARVGGRRGDRAGCGGDGDHGGRLASSKRPQDRAPAPRPQGAGERWRRLSRWRRAGVQCGREGHAQSPRACVRACAGLARPPPSLLGAGPGGERGAEGRGGPALLDDEAAGQVLREVLEELGRGPGAVGQLQLLQLLQLHQARQPGGGQQRAACGGRERRRRLSGRGPSAPRAPRAGRGRATGCPAFPPSDWDPGHGESAPGTDWHRARGGAGAVGLGGGGCSLCRGAGGGGSHLPETGDANSSWPGGASARSPAPEREGGAR